MYGCGRGCVHGYGGGRGYGCVSVRARSYMLCAYLVGSVDVAVSMAVSLLWLPPLRMLTKNDFCVSLVQV